MKDSRLTGLTFLLIIAALIALSLVSYHKAFPWQHVVSVSVTTPSAGLELNPHSDVKLKGLVIGEVAAITSDGTTATVALALDPDQAGLIPATVTASIVPKTLFGEKYVDLVPPAGARTGPSLAEGAVIRQTRNSVEIGELFTNTQNLLRAVRPDQLSLAVGSLAQALRGRGAQLGDTAALLRTYLAGINPRLPTLTHDISQLAATSDSYAAAAPDLLRVLGDGSAVSTDLLVAHEGPLRDVLRAAPVASDALTDLARRSGRDVVSLNHRARPVLGVVADYSPVLPCLVDTVNVTNAAIDHILGGAGPYLAASVEVIAQRAPYRYPDDLPSNPKSTGNNRTLPEGVPSWEPHCTAIPSQLRGIRDVAPYELRDRATPAPEKGGGR
ncbi:MCE family protein [Pseudonocardia spinosispora]|uniref:MCE family protein n=1 Tax=Pseudonocardia spinosispora TaxID=103441 RepID=UPI00041384B7|nr:MCE family protein [Pseudonocardia spinosispora]